MLFKEGVGVPQDYAEAAIWLQMAAEQGNAEAQSELGVMYLQGEGVQQSETNLRG
jgi:TPR repeat protein